MDHPSSTGEPFEREKERLRESRIKVNSPAVLSILLSSRISRMLMDRGRSDIRVFGKSADTFVRSMLLTRRARFVNRALIF